MTYDIETLLRRNLHEVFGEADDKRRHAAAAEIFTENAEFHEPGGIYKGPAEIARIAGVIRATHPDFRYSELGPAEVLHEAAGRVSWISGRPGEAPSYSGTDFIIAKDGRISGLYLFFDPLPGGKDC